LFVAVLIAPFNPLSDEGRQREMDAVYLGIDWLLSSPGTIYGVVITALLLLFVVVGPWKTSRNRRIAVTYGDFNRGALRRDPVRNNCREF